SLSTRRTCRLSLTSTPRKKESSVSNVANSSRSWIILTPTGGKEAATARRACSLATTSSPSVGTCKPLTRAQRNGRRNNNNNHHRRRHRFHRYRS
ncbi:unnamed protein product, partial [Tetraodon nigroviridis]